jgi:hypothetical protein
MAGQRRGHMVPGRSRRAPRQKVEEPTGSSSLSPTELQSRLIAAVERIAQRPDLFLLTIDGHLSRGVQAARGIAEWFASSAEQLSALNDRGAPKLPIPAEATEHLSREISVARNILENVDLGDPGATAGFNLGVFVGQMLLRVAEWQRQHYDRIENQLSAAYGRPSARQRVENTDKRSIQAQAAPPASAAKGYFRPEAVHKISKEVVRKSSSQPRRLLNRKPSGTH